ncbi:MAG: hypothetical protein ACLFVQ_13575, partial [Chitinispirillaceae bacterium]
MIRSDPAALIKIHHLDCLCKVLKSGFSFGFGNSFRGGGIFWGGEEGNVIDGFQARRWEVSDEPKTGRARRWEVNDEPKAGRARRWEVNDEPKAGRAR